MALPLGVTTATVTVGVPVSHTGAAVKTFVSIEPSAFLVHAATGTPLVDFLEELSIAEGVAGQFTLPHTDQDGFTDEAGNAYTNWYYTARISYSTPSKAKSKAPKIKVFQLATGQTTVDLDKLPGGAPALPYTAATAKVDAFNGRTGPVELLDEDLPERLSEQQLSASFARRDIERLSSFTRARGALVVTVDDGYPSWHQFVAEANDRGQKLTLAVTTNHVNTTYGISSQHIADWHAQGHEIASHSVTHARMSQVSIASRVAEYDNSKSFLEGIIGAGNVTTWVYPFGLATNRDNATDSELWGRYKRIMDTVSGNSHHYRELAMPFLIGRDSWDTTTHASVLEGIRNLVHTPMIMSLYSHGPDSGIGNEISTAQFTEGLELAYQLGIPVITAAEAFPVGSPVINPGFEADIAGWRGASAGGTMNVVTTTPGNGMPGSKVLELSSTGTTDLITYQQIPVRPGTQYTLSAQARLTAGTISAPGQVGVRIRRVDNAGAAQGWDTQSAWPVSAWGRITTSYTIPANYKQAQIELYITGQAGLTAQFDHVWFGPTSFGDFG